MAETVFYVASTLAAGYGAYQAGEAAKMPIPKTPGAPPAPDETGTAPKSKARKYRPPAQTFKDDLRLGMGGTLGGSGVI